jgi:putative SOS response-associated peptidase YedK
MKLFPDKLTYNARSEGFNTTWAYLSNNRAIIEVESFMEGTALFEDILGSKLKLACIYSPQNKVAILTMPSNDKVIAYHHRMPVIVNNNEDYYLTSKVINFNKFKYNYLKVA